MQPHARILQGGCLAGILLLPFAAAAQEQPNMAPAISITPAPSLMQRHRPIAIHRQRSEGQYDSYNWSGYAVTGSNGSVTDIYGAWTVPAVNCSAAPNSYSSFWVGIDGFNSTTVEQIGTDSDCVSLRGQTNTPTYYAWFEFYPQSSYLIEFPTGIQPGDLIIGEVKFTGQSQGGYGWKQSAPQFTVTLTDVTRFETYSTTSQVPNASQSSAEWIAEAPCCTKSGGVLPLADFVTVLFGGSGAVIQGVNGWIGAFGGSAQEITMVGENAPNAVKAQPSNLYADGSAFSVSWISPGP